MSQTKADVYTRTGDDGSTGLLGGTRVPKDSPQVEAYGTVDELNATLGVSRAAGVPDDIDAALEDVQHQLFALGAELAMAASQAAVTPRDIESLERQIDHHDQQLPPLKQFILPAGPAAASHL